MYIVVKIDYNGQLIISGLFKYIKDAYNDIEIKSDIFPLNNYLVMSCLVPPLPNKSLDSQ